MADRSPEPRAGALKGSGMGAPTVVQVVFLKYDGRPHRSYPARFLGEDESGTWLGVAAGHRGDDDEVVERVDLVGYRRILRRQEEDAAEEFVHRGLASRDRPRAPRLASRRKRTTIVPATVESTKSAPRRRKPITYGP